MQQDRFDFLVFIGRFQPFHLGHLDVIKQGLSRASKLILLCGSAHQPRSLRNPWTVEERADMLSACLTPEEKKRLIIQPLMDCTYNDERWVRNVQSTVNGLVTAHFDRPHLKPEIGLIGHNKDQSSYYLNLFPQWASVAVENRAGISATPLREAFFTHSQTDFAESIELTSQLPDQVQHWLTDFRTTGHFESVASEAAFVKAYRAQWHAAPYEPMFITLDALVVQSGHLLMIERGQFPGKGLLALPGGFLDGKETLLRGCLRELTEETQLDVAEEQLIANLKKQQVFDDPYRSARGRTVTHAFYFELPPKSELPDILAGDDASQAHWIPLGELNPQHIFEDHYFIIQQMTGM